MKTVLSIFLLFLAVSVLGQEAAKTDTIRKDALNVYMSADSYIKKEVTFINYVRDLKSADLYIIISSQSTGSGGEAATCFLVGQNRFAGMNDTLVINFSPDETQDVSRTKAVKLLKMALMRYMLKTPLANYFNVNFTAPVKEIVSTDKWNSWVFSTNFNGDFQKEKSYRSVSLNAGFSASRVTEKNKFMFDYSYGWDENQYDYGDTPVKSFYRNQYAEAEYVIGLNDHWSTGLFLSGVSSVYNNCDFSYSIMPALEYNIFPYSMSTRRQMRLTYRIGYAYYDYRDTTLYDKISENLYQHSISCNYAIIEKWGNISLRLSYSNFLHDWSKNSVSASSNLSLRIAKGLNFHISGGGSIIHNQLSLTKGGLTYEETLLRRREMATSFSLYTYFGLSYTFGSIYNNAVNPRFGGGSYYY
ncbi:MAG: hypothetical protein U0X39_05610 [Bacteroidales bacterium]